MLQTHGTDDLPRSGPPRHLLLPAHRPEGAAALHAGPVDGQVGLDKKPRHEGAGQGQTALRPLPVSPALPSDAEIEAEVLAGILAADELERLELDPRQQFQTPEERAQWPDLVKLKPRGMADDWDWDWDCPGSVDTESAFA